ncbi:heat shock protein DnaJ domain protein [Halothece sp. PCC 7418]|nr:tetratricopeptide repeat protein [Halothece sp. PCC 7418]AFZ44130.1 heat shock protein DnaJ domain protein [Halothece sp. PCC 7418]
MPTLAPIKCGLFQFNIVDYHAVLGVPIGASSDLVRKRYLKVTRLLFPDIRHLNKQEDNDLADQLLSKLVNPAYENLFKNQSACSEHLLVLQQIGTRVAQQGKLRLKSKKAQELAQAGEKGNLDSIYQKYLNSIINQQYQDLDKALQKIALLSEFNLVYLMLKNGEVAAQKKVSVQPKTPESSEPKPREAPSSKETQEQVSPEEKMAKMVEPYLRRGKQFIDKQDYTKAIMELREALKLNSQNSQAHTLLGLAYVKQNQLGMAKIHINKALQIDPKNEMALEGKQVLEKLLKQGQGTDGGKKANGNRGLLGGLFGKKKK